MKKILILSILFFINTNSYASGYCKNLKIEEVRFYPSQMVFIPESNYYSSRFRFVIEDANGTNSGYSDAIKIAFSTGKSVSFGFYAKNEDGVVKPNWIACSAAEIGDWEDHDMVVTRIVLSN